MNMARKDIQRHIEEGIREDRDNGKEGRDDRPVDVAMQNLVCTECGKVNATEPRPLTVPDVKTGCGHCDELTLHEYRVDGEITEVVAEESATKSSGGLHD